jgi:xylan 1,4-beta-xylosidase
LEKSGQLEMIEKPQGLKAVKGQLKLNFPLPTQGVSLLKLEWK